MVRKKLQRYTSSTAPRHTKEEQEERQDVVLDRVVFFSTPLCKTYKIFKIMKHKVTKWFDHSKWVILRLELDTEWLMKRMGIEALIHQQHCTYTTLTSEFLTKLDVTLDLAHGTGTLTFQLGNFHRFITIV